jgi:hypothetical protein
VITSSATLLFGHFCLVYSVALYGRHVYQEAQGTRRAVRAKPVAADESKPKKARTASRGQTVVGSKNVRVDAAHEKPNTESAPAAVPTISKQSIQKAVSAAEEQDATGNNQAMSKAERRRLRKVDRRQQRQDDNDD